MLSRGIEHLKVGKLACSVADDCAGDAKARLRGQSEIDFSPLARDHGNWGSERNIRACRIIDYRETERSGICRAGGNRHRTPTGSCRQIIRAGLKLGDAELSVFIRRAALAILPNLAAVLQALDHQLNGQIFDRFAIVSGDPAIDDAFGNELEDGGRNVRPDINSRPSKFGKPVF